MNEERQIFITRGGKKKYFLHDKFLRCLSRDYKSEREIKLDNNLQEISSTLVEMLNKKNLGEKTKTDLAYIQSLVQEIL